VWGRTCMSLYRWDWEIELISNHGCSAVVTFFFCCFSSVLHPSLICRNVLDEQQTPFIDQTLHTTISYKSYSTMNIQVRSFIRGACILPAYPFPSTEFYSFMQPFAPAIRADSFISKFAALFSVYRVTYHHGAAPPSYV
jgi:hypothetical protein